MLKEIYFRDPTDPKFSHLKMDETGRLEAVLSKIRMILYTNKGEVLGEPEFGMSLEQHLFEFGLNEGVVREKFRSQVAKYIPEASEYDIDCSVQIKTDGYQDVGYLYITLQGEPQINIQL